MSIELYASTPAVGLLKGFSPLPHQRKRRWSDPLF